MRRSLTFALVLVAGVVGGAGLTIVLQPEPAEPLPPIVTGVGDTRPAVVTTVPVTAPPASGPGPLSAQDPEPPRLPEGQDRVLLVWTSGGLPDGFAARVAGIDAVSAVTVVKADPRAIAGTRAVGGAPVDALPDGFLIPFEVMAFDPATYRAFVPAPALAAFTGLRQDEMLLGRTSAQIRRIGEGATIELAGGAVFTVAGVVDDVLIGAAEGAVAGGDEAEVGTERYLLARYRGRRDLVEAAIRAELPPGVPARIRSPGETPVLRHGDAVLPQVFIKELFGEFSYRPGSGRNFEQDPAWRDANIVAIDLPFLGPVTCHRALAPALQGAFADLQRQNLGFLIDPTAFRGCHNPRLIDAGRGVSRHSWGVAIDLSFSPDPEVQSAAQDPRLIEVMARWGFVSGHDWLVPDAGHFEYVRPPVAQLN